MRPRPDHSDGPPRLRTVALPVEHGGWGLLAEPIVLGLALAPTAAGAALGVAACGAFLARHPLRLWLSDRRRGAFHPRTALVGRVAAAYALTAAAALGVAVTLAGTTILLPLSLAVPLGALQVAYDARSRGRELLAELAGAVALGAPAAALTLAGGWPAGHAFALWLLLAVRAAAAVVYVRARLRRARGVQAGAATAWTSHAAGLALAAALAAAGHVPRLAVVAFAALLVRAVYGLAASTKVRPRVVGVQELAYGLLTVALLAVGYLGRVRAGTLVASTQRGRSRMRITERMNVVSPPRGVGSRGRAGDPLRLARRPHPGGGRTALIQDPVAPPRSCRP